MLFLYTLALICFADGQLEKNSSKQPLALQTLQTQRGTLLSSSHSHAHSHSHSHEAPAGSASSQNEEASALKNHFPEAVLTAQQFLMHLLRQDWEEMLELAAFPFWLESKTYASPQALREAWEKQLSQKRLDNYEVRGIEVLTLPQMKERFGPPPERFGKLLLGQSSPLFAVANVSGRAVVLLLQPPSRHAGFKVVAFHD